MAPAAAVAAVLPVLLVPQLAAGDFPVVALLVLMAVAFLLKTVQMVLLSSSTVRPC